MIRNNDKGFTLIELAVVLVIISILASVAIPRFLYVRSKACASEFPTVLSQIYVAEGITHVATGSYQLAESLDELKDNLSIEFIESKYFTYYVDEADANSFIATAEVKLAFADVVLTDKATINADGEKDFSDDTNLHKYVATWKDQDE